MKKFLKRYSIIIVILLIFVLGYYSGISFEDILKEIEKLSQWQIVVVVSWFFLISSLIIIGKKMILYFMGYNVQIKNIVTIHFASISAHYSTPAKIGFPVSIYLLNKLEKVPVAVATASIVLELFASIFITVVIGLIGSIIYFRDQLQFFSRELLFVSAALLIVLLGLYVVYKKSIRIQKMLDELKNAIKLLTYKKLIIYFLLQLIVHSSVAIYLVIIAYFFDTDVSFWHAFVAYSSAYIIGAISMVPMGLGARDISMVYYLSSFGAAPEIAVIITAIQRLISTGLGYSLGLLAGGIIGVNSITSTKNSNE